MTRLENNKFSIFKEMVDIRLAIQEVCGIMKFQLTQKNLALNVSISQLVPHKILTDIKRFKQILFNLMGNASKFTFKGYLSVSVDFEDRFLISTVADTGIGIQEADLNKLFRFFGKVTKSKDINRGGMGLGLTISKMILQQLEGTILVESEPNKGSSFTFKIPISDFQFEE